ncbi:MAG: ABC transporter permease [Alphaproteobacteria bacterium]|nr:MAG: ABC transporter permease [Alphaproteobacteria bacterium]
MTAVLNAIGRGWLILTLAFLYLPILVMAAMSFNASPFYRLPVEFSTRWYAALMGNAALKQAAWNSVWIALVTTAIATALGTAAAIGLHRHRFPGRALLQAALYPPIAIPWLITGTAMLVFFYFLGIPRGSPAVVVGHVALAIPYVVIVVGARLKGFDPALEEAARSLGARPWQVAAWVTLPYLAPAVIAAALFAFAVSFDQFVISYFLAAPGDTTLPVEIYAAIRKGFTPEVNAVSTIVIGLSMALMLLVARLARFGEVR